MINILYGGNYKVFDGILLSVMSITKYCKDEICVYVLTSNLTELNSNFTPITAHQIETLNKVLKNSNNNSLAKLILLDNDFKSWVFNSLNKTNSYTPFAFLRLFADNANLPEKIIYLDTDIMANGNIKELFDVDIDNYELGIVKDRYGKIFINPNYFNSGMLLMNLKLLKINKTLEKVREFCATKKMSFPDQTALNKVCKNKLYLSRKFNEQGQLKPNTILHHFSKRIKWFPFFKTLNIKPWEIDKVQKIYKCHAYDDIYEEYQKLK